MRRHQSFIHSEYMCVRLLRESVDLFYIIKSHETWLFLFMDIKNYINKFGIFFRFVMSTYCRICAYAYAFVCVYVFRDMICCFLSGFLLAEWVSDKQFLIWTQNTMFFSLFFFFLSEAIFSYSFYDSLPFGCESFLLWDIFTLFSQQHTYQQHRVSVWDSVCLLV